MKGILRNVIIHSVSLFLLAQLAAGVKISGGVQTFILGGAVLYLISLLIKPILNILTLPFNLATFGAFSFLTNALMLYLLTILISQIIISPFVFPGLTFAGFIIPKIAFNLFFAYVVSAFVLSVITSAVKWFID